MQQNHNFNPEKKASERKTLIVLIITILTMVVEIFTGWLYNSIALFSDGCHMSTHAAALGLTLLAYYFARKFSTDRRFVFGTWKIEILGAYTSSILLGLVGLFVLFISIERIFSPESINYNYALLVALIGLIVNLISALILQGSHSHSHEHNHHDENQEHHHHHDDLNLRSAYLHVVADALTSVFAIIALLGAKFMHWNWLDPLMGIVGSVLIFRWTYFLVKETSTILLDRSIDLNFENEIIATIEKDQKSKVADIHLWKVAQNKFSCILSIEGSNISTISEYRNRLSQFEKLVHITIEVDQLT